MVWFYERSGMFIRCETRDVSPQLGTFELIVTQADGTERVERFEDSESLINRQQELEASLLYGGWCGPFGRLL